MQVKGSKEIRAGVLDSGLCTGCGACVSLCPYYATHKGRTVMHFSCTREEGRCHAHCPRAEVNLDRISSQIFGEEYSVRPFGSYINIHSARAGDKAGVSGFQTAGTVSALIKFAFEKGYIDSAVLTKNEEGFGVPVVIDNAGDVEKASGSRYSVSPTVKGVNDAINSGRRKIGAVGTPCQTLAVAQLRGNPLKQEGFTDPISLSIGLFCTWALTASDFTVLLKSMGDISTIRRLDIPPPPASFMEIETGNKSYIIPLDDIRKLIPEACSYCHDMTAEFADISVGVFEGKEKQNIAIIRTERGRKIFEEAVNAGYLETEKIPEEAIAPLAAASMNKKKRGLAKLAEADLINSESGHTVLRVDKSTLESIFKGGASCC